MGNNHQPPGYADAEAQAREVIRQHEQLRRMLEDAGAKVRKHRHRLRKVLDELELLISMVRAYASGEYREMPWRALLTAAAAVVYFVNPLDLVPDFLPLLGFVDDAAVIGFVVESLREEMRRYQGFLHQDEPPAEDHENG